MEETDADVDLRLNGKVVSRCCMDAVFSLEFLEKRFRTVIRIGRQMIIEHGQMRLDISAEKPTQAKEALVLLGKIISHAVGRKDGSLDVTFTDGDRLIVPVDRDYEAWEISSTDGFMIVSIPGGGLTTWKPNPRQATDSSFQDR